MNKYTLIIILLISIIGIAVFVYISNQSSDSKVINTPQNLTQVTISSDSSKTQQNTQDKIISQTGTYQAYSSDKLRLAEAGKVILFFHASWCPTCRALNSDIEKNIISIPYEVNILKTDYDQESNLKQKYGVTTQHTLVQVDSEGNLIKKWSGGSILTSILEQII